MDILLTHGYYLYEDPHELAVMKPYPPLGILYVASHLKSRGFDVAVFDTTFSSRESFRRYVEIERPPVVGVYCNLMTRRTVLEMIRICKGQGALVVLGGPEPANYSEEYLARGADLVVIGEGEITLEELLPHLARRGMDNLEQIEEIVYRAGDGSLVRTTPRPHIANLDAQPFPDRAAIDIDQYSKVWRNRHGMTSASLITGRGCPYACAWCSHAVFGYSHRRRTPGNVADEVELLMQSYEPDMLWYADDVFTLQPRWLIDYASELERRKLRVPFETISREDRLDEETIRCLAQMGCYRLWIGAESGSQRVLDDMDRHANAARLREITRLMKRYGIESGLFVMLGYEGEEATDLKATVEQLKAAAPDLYLTTVAYPVKGTPYYDRVASRVLPLPSWEDGSDRELRVAGRHSRRFYSFACRWMAGEVAWHRMSHRSDRDYRRKARALFNMQVGRLGMLLTDGEVEGE